MGCKTVVEFIHVKDCASWGTWAVIVFFLISTMECLIITNIISSFFSSICVPMVLGLYPWFGVPTKSFFQIWISVKIAKRFLFGNSCCTFSMSTFFLTDCFEVVSYPCLFLRKRIFFHFDRPLLISIIIKVLIAYDFSIWKIIINVFVSSFFSSVINPMFSSSDSIAKVSNIRVSSEISISLLIRHTWGFSWISSAFESCHHVSFSCWLSVTYIYCYLIRIVFGFILVCFHFYKFAILQFLGNSIKHFLILAFSWVKLLQDLQIMIMISEFSVSISSMNELISTSQSWICLSCFCFELIKCYYW